MRRYPGSRVFGAFAGMFVALLLLGACASDPRAAAPVSTSRRIELQEESAIATFHFPRGLYSLDSEDDSGFYYRAPRSVMKHSFAGFTKYEGGIFVEKRRQRIRGYIWWAGGRTRIGRVAPAVIKFLD